MNCRKIEGVNSYDDYLSKPIQPKALFEAIGRLMAQRAKLEPAIRA